MSRSSSSSWFSRIATSLLTLLLVGLVVFFGLTRTEVGRDGLRIQLERQFDNQFAGSLRIERLDGNLVNTLFARNVQVRGPGGRVVVQADSVVLRPSWHMLLNRTLSLRSVDIHSTHVVAERTEDGMPLAQAFRSNQPAETEGGFPLDLSLPDFRLHDLHMTTRHDGPAPNAIANGWVMDLLNTTVELPRADIAVAWSEEERYADVELRDLAHSASNLMIEQLSGRVERTDTGWMLRPITLSTDRSSVRLSGSWSNEWDANTPFALSLQADPLDFDEWGRLFPRLPNRDPLVLNADLRGPLSDLAVETVRLEQGGAALAFEGTAIGFPNDIDVEGALQAENVTRTTATAWVPGNLPPPLEAALPLSGEVYARGQVRATAAPDRLTDWRPSSATGAVEVDLASEAGDVDATTDLEWATNEQLAYTGTLNVEQLAVGTLVPNAVPRPSTLTGQTTVEGTGIDPSTATVEADFDLGPSTLAGSSFQGAEGRISLNSGLFSGRATLMQRSAQQLTTTWEWDTRPEGSSSLYATLKADAFDVSPWVERWQQTDFTGTLTAQAELSADRLRAGQLDIDIDSSSVTPQPPPDVEAEPRSLPAHRITAQLTPPENAPQSIPRLFVGGDVLSITAGGSGWTLPRMRLLPAWARAVATTIAYEHAAEGMSAPNLITPPALQQAVGPPSLDHPTWTPPEQADGAFSLWSKAQLHRPEVVRAWLPQAPETADELTVQTKIYAAPDSMHSTLHLTADDLRFSPAEARAVDLRIDVGADSSGTLPDRLRLHADGHADHLHTPAASFFTPSLQFSYEQRRGSLSFATEEREETGPIQLEANLRAFDQRNELIIQHISATAGPHAWHTKQASTWTLYANQITGTPLELTSAASLPDREVQQSIIIDGRFSPDPDDALNVELNNVQLLPLSQLAGWSQPLGGEVNGDLEIGGTWSTPISTGNIDIGELSFDRHLLGDLSLTTRYIAGEPDLEMALSLQPSPGVEDPGDATRALVPNGIRQVVDNRLDLGGRLRIADSAPGWEDDEWIDLALDIERADLFFFDFIFADVLSDIEGATQGTATITGQWSRPIFDSDLTVDGAFSIPRFGLSYTLNGPVQVDRQGIHLQDAELADNDDGSALIGGSVLFNDYQFFSFDLESTVDNLTIMDVPRADDLPFYGFIRASGPLELTGPLSNTELVSDNARTSEDTEVFIPAAEEAGGSSSGFLIYADSTSQLFDWDELTRRANIFADRPAGEASFLDGMEIDLNIEATRGGRLHIVFDALVGDVITTEATGRVQLQREDGEFFIFGSMDVVGGTYLFTAGEVFVRRFSINEGTLSWDGDPINAELDIDAAFRTRASPAGLPGFSERSARIPVVIDLDITGRVETPEVALSLSIDRDQRDQRVGSQTFDALLNQDARMTEFATSVLLTNTFLLTTDNISGNGSGPNESGRLANTGGQLAFNSVSQLVSSQLNRYLSEALPNVDINVGVQGETADDLDIIYGVALRLLDERLIIRGEGVYTGNDEFRAQQSGPQGEVAVEVRLSDQVSMEVFYRRIGDDLTQGQTLTSTTGVGLFYQTQFRTWGTLWRRILGRPTPDASRTEIDETDASDNEADPSDDETDS